MSTQRSLLLFKPDAIVHEMVDQGIADVRASGLRVVARRRFDLTESQLAGMYFRIFPDERALTAGLLRRYLVGRTVETAVVEGPEALARLLEYKSATRARLGGFLYGNFVHCPDSLDEAERQIEVLTGDGPGHGFRPTGPLWRDWPLADCERALDGVWADVPGRGLTRPARWSPWPPAAGLRITVPARWVIAFDDIAVFLARLLGTDTPEFGVRATLAALYDPGGLATPATGDEAAELAAQVREFGLLAAVPARDHALIAEEIR
ncbi:nucleoside-diphosphate kinase [Streptomyces sp. NPDC001351]|uniref:nucleoside-diphosphate kinase n=1 Tax=Streptomyces sp. NPDC001351 TaxID=3364564 RepID=UPI003681931B